MLIRFFAFFMIVIVFASGWLLLWIGGDEDSPKHMARGIVLIFVGLAMLFTYGVLVSRGLWLA